jgi:glutamate formiminotransferase
VLECVPNIAIGERDPAIATAAGRSLLDLHVDADHQRAVVTLAGPDPRDAELAMRNVAHALAERSFVGYQGVHPCIGVVDVVPFVALGGTDRAVAAAAAHDFGQWAAGALDLPVFFYGDADPDRRSLPSVRQEAFSDRPPDRGPSSPHPRLGATAVGARPPLVAVNCWLATSDRTVAPRIAAAVRERDGGLPGVRALGLWLPAAAQAQVSMNVTALERTGVEAACETVRSAAGREGAGVTAVELVWLVPVAEYERWSDGFRQWSGIGPHRTIEARLGAPTA